MADAVTTIRADMTLLEVRQRCEETLPALGADDFWYWGIGAFVFSGEDTVLSISGKDYETAHRTIADHDIVTIDLSPRKDGLWGDYARTLIVENGRALHDPTTTTNSEWAAGVRAQQQLHARVCEIATPTMTFHDLHQATNAHIRQLGYENLDFLGNLGHSIERRSEDRVYVESGNMALLGSVAYFTFEPHVRLPSGQHGYKYENIYRFDNGHLTAL